MWALREGVRSFTGNFTVVRRRKGGQAKSRDFMPLVECTSTRGGKKGLGDNLQRRVRRGILIYHLSLGRA